LIQGSSLSNHSSIANVTTSKANFIYCNASSHGAQQCFKLIAWVNKNKEKKNKKNNNNQRAQALIALESDFGNFAC
jgi:hypothetical protein